MKRAIQATTAGSLERQKQEDLFPGIISTQRKTPAITASTKDIMFIFNNQFSESQKYIRELLQNSIDAEARHIKIGYKIQPKKLIIDYLDDGIGIDHKGFEDFRYLFRSNKAAITDLLNEQTIRKTAGWLGVGRVSVFAEKDLVSIRFFSLAANGPSDEASILTLHANENYSGELHFVDPKEMKDFLNTDRDTGTKIQVTVNVQNDEDALARISILNDTIINNGSWAIPRVEISIPDNG